MVVYDDEWFYVEEGWLDIEKSGFVDYNGGRFLVAAGQIVRTQNGLTQDPNTGEWYYLAEGQVVDVTTLAEYDGAWFYIIMGKLAEDYTGIVEYNGAEFNVVNGMVK